MLVLTKVWRWSVVEYYEAASRQFFINLKQALCDWLYLVAKIFHWPISS